MTKRTRQQLNTGNSVLNEYILEVSKRKNMTYTEAFEHVRSQYNSVPLVKLMFDKATDMGEHNV